jgi:16S rRNA (cytosine1402-N4)-methyltransferase
LSLLGNKGRLYAFDQDEETINNIQADDRFTFVRGNFRYLKNFIRYYDVDGVDAILADLGVSSHHFDSESRGFSFRFEGSSLDMRMNQKGGKTAAQILNTYPEEKLADVFYLYGELKQSRRIAAAIVKGRKENLYKKTSDLLNALNPFAGKGEKEKKILARAFQALRIEVNEEMETLKEMLEQALDILKPGGRLSVITYHSLEDRIVKNFFKTGNFEGKVEKDFFGNFAPPFKLINNKVITPSREEEERNPRSRSAKLRIAEKI